jgi:hypothetical protein
LDAKVAEAADPMDRHQVARFRAAVPQRVEGGDAAQSSGADATGSSASDTCASAETSASMRVA